MSKSAKRYTRKEKKSLSLAPTPKQERRISLTPQTENQRTYANHLNTQDLIFTIGCAGTGKTYMAATKAAMMYNDAQIKRIIITRPNIPSSRSLGAFPGTLEEKMAPWVLPVIEILRGHLGRVKVETMLKDRNIVVEPFETMRGRTFDDAFILLDEAQNTTYDELKMFLTRLGEGSKVVVNGDVAQTDLKHTSGLRTIINIIKGQMLAYPVVEMTEEDIVRSDVCADWIRAFSKHEKRP